MPDLTSRAEEALLGALITDPWQLASVPGITPADFTDPARQAVFTAITHLHDREPAASGSELADLIAAAGDRQVTAGYLDQIMQATPTPHAAAVYGRMIIEASFDRQLGAHAAEARAAVLVGDEPGQAAVIADIIATLAGNLQAARAAVGETPAGPGAPPPGDPQAVLEERFLAALMREPAITEWITVDPQVFTSPARREVYEAIVSIDQYGEPVDELTLTWALARDAAISRADAGRLSSRGEFAAAIPAAMIARLAASPAGTPTGVEAARDLLAGYTRAEIARATAAERMPGHHGVTAAAAPWQHDIAREPLLTRPPDVQLGRDAPPLHRDGS